MIGKGSYEGYLTPQPDKQQLLEQMGIDILYVVEFNKEFSQVSPEAFVEEMLFPLNLQTAVVGFDFRFGHKGAGDAVKLQELGEGRMSVVTVPPFLVDGEKVGSSSIRIALKQDSCQTQTAGSDGITTSGARSFMGRSGEERSVFLPRTWN